MGNVLTVDHSNFQLRTNDKKQTSLTNIENRTVEIYYQNQVYMKQKKNKVFMLGRVHFLT